MARESGAAGFGKVVLGGAVGFGLYLLVTGLGFGGSTGRRGASGAEPAPPVPTRPQDEKRLNFLLSPRGFEARAADWKLLPVAKIYSVEEVITRVKEGGRSDMSLKISGAAIQGAVDAALAALKQAGIDVWKMETAPPAHVSGDVRGEYGWRGLR